MSSTSVTPASPCIYKPSKLTELYILIRSPLAKRSYVVSYIGRIYIRIYILIRICILIVYDLRRLDGVTLFRWSYRLYICILAVAVVRIRSAVRSWAAGTAPLVRTDTRTPFDGFLFLYTYKLYVYIYVYVIRISICISFLLLILSSKTNIIPTNFLSPRIFRIFGKCFWKISTKLITSEFSRKLLPHNYSHNYSVALRSRKYLLCARPIIWPNAPFPENVFGKEIRILRPSHNFTENLSLGRSIR